MSSFEDIFGRAKAKWPGIRLDQITIEAEYIRTKCLGYDQYDPSDYNTFIVIRRVPRND